MPHNVKAEWWYASGHLEDEEQNLYFYHFTIFHGVKMGIDGFVTHVSVSDYSAGKRYFTEQGPVKKYPCHIETDNLLCGDLLLSRNEDHFSLHALTDDLEFHLYLFPRSSAVWHGTDGIISMGDPGDSRENSFYFSYPGMDTHGTMVFHGESGPVLHQVEGSSWFDRQWGNFRNTTWDWFSLRFDDGDNIMLFHFPNTGHKEATYIKDNGEVTWFNDFSCRADSSIFQGGSEVGIEWTFDIPYKEGRYRIEPLGNNDLNKSRFGVTYWEGLFRLLNPEGEEVGWSVAEISR